MRVKTTIIIFLISLQAMAGWEPFSPEGIHANRISFYVDNNNNWAVAASGGTYHYHLNTQTWDFYSAILPVVDASWLDGEFTLVIMNAGGLLMEEGIHYLDPASGTYYALKYLETPHFIKYDYATGRFFVGHRSGITYTDNISDWYDLDFFNNMDIVDMEIFEDHYVVSRMDNLLEVYYSNDAGISWTLSQNAPMISDLEFKNTGKLYGVFPDNSWSSGLWSSNDYGATWNVEFWVTGINCVGLDAMGSVFVGFGEDAIAPDEGVARWDSVSQSLHYLNDGLPNLNINQITFNPAMSAMAIFCCTDTGVYINYDYVGIEDQSPSASVSLKAWPNPAVETLNIQYDPAEVSSLSIYSANGKKLFNRIIYHPGKLEYDCSMLETGIYIISIENSNGCESLKWIKK